MVQRLNVCNDFLRLVPIPKIALDWLDKRGELFDESFQIVGIFRQGVHRGALFSQSYDDISTDSCTQSR